VSYSEESTVSQANQTQQMTLGQILLTYGLIPVIVLTALGIRRARRAKAGWVAWTPIFLCLATIVVAFFMGFAKAAFGVPAAFAQGAVSLFGLASAVSGIWLFFKFGGNGPRT
jgi:glucan phosphoethanolaminetransferase (alkaline phosphatase superfamily)